MSQTTAPAILDYIEADARARAARYAGFLKALSAASADGAALWARRAVSRDLDYSALRKLRKHALHGRSAEGPRIAVLGGPTTIQLVEMLELFLAHEGLLGPVHQCEYGLFRQELLVPGSDLDRFRPDIVVIATGWRDLMHTPGPDVSAADAREAAARELADWTALWSQARDRWGAWVIQNVFDAPPHPPLGHFARRHASGSERHVHRVNEAMADAAPPHVLLHDIPALIRESGEAAWYDPRFFVEAKMPCAPECLVTYAHSLASLVRAIRGRSRKVLVLDLDNTVWGGTVGDVGPGGIVVGQGSGEGEAYLALQQYAMALSERGVVLAVCSKNDEEKAREPFRARDDLALKLDRIAAFCANWDDKATNLRRIAAQLEVGLDALVFVDDNPAERALVRRFLPEVAVPDMPEDPALYVQAIARHRWFETAALTSEDMVRARYYAENARRNELAASATDLASFLASLEMVARVQPICEANLERVAQLAGKSNQWNLTTRRRGVAEIRQIAADPAWHTFALALADKLGDSGLIAVIMLEQRVDELHIDTWLMSCRVLQRGVEELALNLMVRKAKTLGCRRLVGRYLRTARNGMVADLFPRLGFRALGEAEGETSWYLPVADYQPRPVHIEEMQA